MPTIQSVTVTPTPVRCGQTIQVDVLTTFPGASRTVTVCVQIPAPCTLDGASQQCATRHGTSPLLITVRGRLDCPPGDRHLMSGVTATDDHEDTDSSAVDVMVIC